MSKRYIAFICVAIVLCFACTAMALAAESQSTGDKAKTFWQKLFNYPANVTRDSVNVVAETGKKGTAVVVNEVKTVGQVTSGDVNKTKDLVVDPLKGTADTAKTAIEGTANVPVEAANQ